MPRRRTQAQYEHDPTRPAYYTSRGISHRQAIQHAQAERKQRKLPGLGYAIYTREGRGHGAGYQPPRAQAPRPRVPPTRADPFRSSSSFGPGRFQPASRARPAPRGSAEPKRSAPPTFGATDPFRGRQVSQPAHTPPADRRPVNVVRPARHAQGRVQAEAVKSAPRPATVHEQPKHDPTRVEFHLAHGATVGQAFQRAQQVRHNRGLYPLRPSGVPEHRGQLPVPAKPRELRGHSHVYWDPGSRLWKAGVHSDFWQGALLPVKGPIWPNAPEPKAEADGGGGLFAGITTAVHDLTHPLHHPAQRTGVAGAAPRGAPLLKEAGLGVGKVLGPVVGLARNAAENAAELATGAPMLAVTAGKAGYHDLKAMTSLAGLSRAASGRGPPPSKEQPTAIYEQVIKPQIEGFKQTWGGLDPRHFDPGRFARQTYHRPLNPLLDVLGGTELGLHALERAGVRVPGSAFRREARTGRVPEPPHRRLGPTGAIQLPVSTSRAGLGLQHAYDALSRRLDRPGAGPLRTLVAEGHRGVGGVGETARVARRIPYEAQRGFERNLAEGVILTRHHAWLRRHPTMNAAGHAMLRYGDAEAADFLRSELASRKARLRNPDVSVAEKDLQRHNVKEINKILAVVKNPPPRLLEAVNDRRLVSEQGTKYRQQAGLISPTAAEEAPQLHARLATGAKFVDLPGEPAVLAGRRAQLRTAQREFAQAHIRREKAVDVAIHRRRQALRTRIRARIEKEQVKPHTIESAQAVINRIDDEYANAIETVRQHQQTERVSPERAQALLDEHDQRIAQAEAAHERARASRQPGEGMTAEEEQTRKATAARPEDVKALGREVAKLKRQRAPFVRALKSGRLEQQIDRSEISRRNKARAGAKKRGASEAELRVTHPTHKQEEAMHAEEQLNQLISERHATDPFFANLALRLEHRDTLARGISQLEEKYQFGTETPSPEEVAQHLGHPPMSRAQQLRIMREVVGKAGRQPRGQPYPRAVRTAQGRPLEIERGTTRAGVNLGEAKRKLGIAERAAVRRYGHLPEPGAKKRTVLLGGRRAKAPGYIGDVPRYEGRFGLPTTRKPRRAARDVTKQAAPEGFQKMSRGTLFEQGRAARKLTQADEDWARTARAALSDPQDRRRALKLSEPFEDPQNARLKPGYTWFYSGQTVKPPRILTEAAPPEFWEGKTPKEMMGDLHNAYQGELNKVFPSTNEDLAAAAGGPVGSQKWIDAVRRGEIRQIPKRYVRAFENATAYPAPHTGVVGIFDSILNVTNDLTRLALIYLKGAYVPANYASNVAFLAFQQGPWAALNLRHSTETLSNLDLETLRWVDHEVGSGGALAISGKDLGQVRGARGAMTEWVASGMQKLADTGPRRAAYAHEAAKFNIKTQADYTWLRTSKSAKAERVRNAVGERAENAMVRFRGLTMADRRILSRLILVWPWIKGATRYGFRMPIDRPIQAAIAGHMGQAGHEQTKQTLGKLVSFLEQQGIIPVGKKFHGLGTTLVPIVSPAAVSPFTTFGQSASIAAGLLSNRFGPASSGALSLAQPWLTSAVTGLTGYDISSGYPVKKGTTRTGSIIDGMTQGFAIENAIRIALGKHQTEDFTGSPAKQKLYVQEGGWQDAAMYAAFGSMRRRLLNLPAEQAKAHAEARKQMSSEQMLVDDYVTYKKQAYPALKKILDKEEPGGFDKVKRSLDDALAAREARAQNRLAYMKKNGIDNPTSLDRLTADLELLVRQKKITPAQKSRAVKGATEIAKAGPKGLKMISSSIIPSFGDGFFRQAMLKNVTAALLAAKLDLPLP